MVKCISTPIFMLLPQNANFYRKLGLNNYTTIGPVTFVVVLVLLL